MSKRIKRNYLRDITLGLSLIYYCIVYSSNSPNQSALLVCVAVILMIKSELLLSKYHIGRVHLI